MIKNIFDISILPKALFNILIIVFLGVIISSCKNSVSTDERTENVLERFKSGQPKLIGQFKDSLRHGTFYRYNDIGLLLEEKQYRQGKLHGEITKYFENGEVKMLCEYSNGFKRGKNVIYNRGNKLKVEKTYIKTFDDSSLLNTWKVFDNKGEIIEDSSCYFIILNEDSIFKKDEEAMLRVTLPTTFYSTNISYCPVDFMKEYPKFINPEDTLAQFLESNTFEVKLDTDSKGHKFLRGIFLDYYLDESDYYTVHKIFLEYKYFIE